MCPGSVPRVRYPHGFGTPASRLSFFGGTIAGMNVWFVDDRAENRVTWLASFPASVHETCVLRVFPGVPDLFGALRNGDRPDVLFVDFFLDGHYGSDVIERLIAGEGPVPLLIAHSSMAEANVGMVRAGAHLSMEKTKGVPKTLSIEAAIKGPEDLRRLRRAYLH
jgi:hypothetical protein